MEPALHGQREPQSTQAEGWVLSRSEGCGHRIGEALPLTTLPSSPYKSWGSGHCASNDPSQNAPSMAQAKAEMPSWCQFGEDPILCQTLAIGSENQ